MEGHRETHPRVNKCLAGIAQVGLATVPAFTIARTSGALPAPRLIDGLFQDFTPGMPSPFPSRMAAFPSVTNEGGMASRLEPLQVRPTETACHYPGGVSNPFPLPCMRSFRFSPALTSLVSRRGRASPRPSLPTRLFPGATFDSRLPWLPSETTNVMEFNVELPGCLLEERDSCVDPLNTPSARLLLRIQGVGGYSIAVAVEDHAGLEIFRHCTAQTLRIPCEVTRRMTHGDVDEFKLEKKP